VTNAILVLNAGSSSIKFALHDVDNLEALCRGSIDAIGTEPRLTIQGSRAQDLAPSGPSPAHGLHDTLTTWLIDAIRGRFADVSLVAAGHRVVHGGARFDAPVRIDQNVLAELGQLIELAPGHEPHNLAAIRAIAKSWPELPQVACFDTEFHRTQPRLAQLFALPRYLIDEGVLRYGFHGLSYEYIGGVLPDFAGRRADGRVIVAHLGNGASMCAMKNRRSVATTMGYTALDGLMMGTRSGTLDPGVILHLLAYKGLSVAEVTDLLYNKSGLLGVSGITGDVRQLEASTDPNAAEALDLFAYRASRELGSLVAALGGLDVLVFTAGIGEHSAGVRRRICEQAAWAGVVLDAAANEAGGPRISAISSVVEVFVIPTNEELVIARSTRKFVLDRSGLNLENAPCVRTSSRS
jgi:acetate kinase